MVANPAGSEAFADSSDAFLFVFNRETRDNYLFATTHMSGNFATTR